MPDVILALVLSGGLELSAATPGLFCRCFARDTNVAFLCVCTCEIFLNCVHVRDLETA